MVKTTDKTNRRTHRHVLIIGNGFDLQHGLKTQYKDFVNWLKVLKERKQDNVWASYFVNLNQNNIPVKMDTWIDLETEIEAVIDRYHHIVCSTLDGDLYQMGVTEWADFKQNCLDTLTDESPDGIRATLHRYVDDQKKAGRPFRYEKAVTYLMTIINSLGPSLIDLRRGQRDKAEQKKLIEFSVCIGALKCQKDGVCLERDHLVHLLFRLPIVTTSLVTTFGYDLINWLFGSDNGLFPSLQKKINSKSLGGDEPKNRRQAVDTFIYFLYDQLQRLIDQFNTYLDDVFNTYLADVVKHQADAKVDFDLTRFWGPDCPDDLLAVWTTTDVVSFNYTPTYQTIGQQVTQAPIDRINQQVIHIHGEINHPNMVLGTRTWGQDTPRSNEWNRFQKHTQRMMKDTLSRYQTLIREMKACEQVTIGVVGHSLDISDQAILKHLLKANPNTRVTVYYHNQDHLAGMITHITDMMGEDDVTEKVRFIDQYKTNEDGTENPDGIWKRDTPSPDDAHSTQKRSDSDIPYVKFGRFNQRHPYDATELVAQ